MKNIYKLKLHETCTVSIPGEAVGSTKAITIIRVPGGWLYRYTISTNKSNTMTFVPYDHEFRN